MSTDPFDDLDPLDRATALDLLAAFDGVRLDRPSPVVEQREDADTAARLEEAFSAVTNVRPSPAAENLPGASLVPLPGRRGRRTRVPWLAAAAAAVLLATAVVLWPSGSSVAWAAEPRATSAADRADVQAACSAPLSRGLGQLEGSGSAAVAAGTAPAAPGAPATDLPPSQLPPLSVLDVRGDVAFAVYQDATWTVTCLLRSDDGRWIDQGIQVGPGSSGATPGIVGSGGTQTVDGEAVTTVTGTAPTGASRVTFRLDDGTAVQASVLGTTWAAWFPGSATIDPATITAYDASGRVLDGAAG